MSQENAAIAPTPLALGFVPRYQRGFVLSRRLGWVYWRDVSRQAFYSALIDRELLAVQATPDDVDILLVSGLSFRDGRSVWRARKV